MVLKVETCDDTDMQRTFTIISSAFGHEHPYMEYVFPNHATAPGRKIGGERLLAMKNGGDPHATFLKVTDTDTGEMIAQAKWNVYDGVVPAEAELEGEFWENPEDKEYAQHLFRGYLAPRGKAIRDSGGRLVSLDLLTVDPEHQRRGAGRLLVRWGTAVADRMGVECVVEATDYGRRLYESEGCEVKDHYVVPVPEKWAGRKRQKFIWMVRPVHSDGNTDEKQIGS